MLSSYLTSSGRSTAACRSHLPWFACLDLPSSFPQFCLDPPKFLLEDGVARPRTAPILRAAGVVGRTMVNFGPCCIGCASVAPSCPYSSSPVSYHPPSESSPTSQLLTRHPRTSSAFPSAFVVEVRSVGTVQGGGGATATLAPS
jgi:hypothetical protein